MHFLIDCVCRRRGFAKCGIHELSSGNCPFGLQSVVSHSSATLHIHVIVCLPTSALAKEMLAWTHGLVARSEVLVRAMVYAANRAFGKMNVLCGWK